MRRFCHFVHLDPEGWTCILRRTMNGWLLNGMVWLHYKMGELDGMGLTHLPEFSNWVVFSLHLGDVINCPFPNSIWHLIWDFFPWSTSIAWRMRDGPRAFDFSVDIP